jgi:cytoskeleton-associated protein 5
MDNVKKAVSATNPAVRNAAMNLIGTLYLYLGTQLSVFFEDEKSQVRQQIQAEFDKVKFLLKQKLQLFLHCCTSSIDVL